MPETASKQIKPFWSRVSLIESPVEETELHNGIVVPSRFEGDDGVKRGVVVAIDHVWDENTPGRLMADQLEPGTVVFYREGIKLPGDIVIVEIKDILAFEAS